MLRIWTTVRDCDRVADCARVHRPLLRLPSLLYSPYMVPPCLIRKIYSSPTRPCTSEHCTSFPFFSTVHSPQCLVGVYQQALTKLDISRRLFHIASWFHALSTRIELQNTFVYRSSPIERTGSAYERRAKTYRTTFVYVLRTYFSLFPPPVSAPLLIFKH